MEHMVSWCTQSGICGNRTVGSLEVAEQFIATNRDHWFSYTLFSCGEKSGIVTVLKEVRYELCKSQKLGSCQTANSSTLVS